MSDRILITHGLFDSGDWVGKWWRDATTVNTSRFFFMSHDTTTLNERFKTKTRQ